MFTNHLKLAFRNMKRNPAFSVINIVGFAFGISICLGIFSHLLHEYSFDSYHANSNRIYRLIDTKDNSSSIDYRVKDILVDTYPGIEAGALLQVVNQPVPVTVDNKGLYIESMASADDGFFQVFTVPFIQGDPENPLPDLHSVVLTESGAQTLFGDENPMGQNVQLRSYTLTVTGVIEDFPDNSSIQARMILNAENDAFKFSFASAKFSDQTTHRWPFRIYLLLHEQADQRSLAAKINSNPELLYPYEEQVGFLALEEMYLGDYTSGSETLQGNPGLLNLLLSIGLIILTLAVINYINLTAAQHHKRYKEIGVKKSMGIRRRDILSQFLTESIVVTFIAFVLAAILLVQSIPVYRAIFYPGFHVSNLLQHWYLLFPSTLLLGILSGISTAYYLSSVNPVRALKGEIHTTRRTFSWRNGLTVFQFVVAIALIFSIIVIQKQIHYVKYSHPGFEEEQLLKITLPFLDPADQGKLDVLAHQFRQHAGIQNIAITNGIPGEITTHVGAVNWQSGKDGYVAVIYADSAFLSTFGVDIIRGRNPLPGDFNSACVINENAFEYFGWNNLENKSYTIGADPLIKQEEKKYNVIGVVNDFHISSMRDAIEPLSIMFQDDYHPTHLSVKMQSGQTAAALGAMQAAWNEILPQYPLEYAFYDSWLDAMYRDDEKLGTAIALFATLAIVISCMGILGMAIVSTQRRTKEIGIRKVVGASISGILMMLSKDFAKWIILANIFALPLAWYTMNHWLQNFAYRITLSWWVFVISGLAVLFIALFTVSWQAIRAATANPVDSLRYE